MTLRSVYDDPATSTRDPKLLAERANTTLKSAQAFLTAEASAQSAVSYRRPKSNSTLAHSSYAPSGAPEGHYQADVIAFELYKGVNKKRKFILTVLHTTTRMAYARGLLDRKSWRVAEAFDDILRNDKLMSERRQRKIKVLRVDGGGEFKDEFAQLCARRHIQLERAEAYTHYKLSRTDRFHRTLRKRIGEHFERENTHDWMSALPAIVANINSTPHATLSDILGRQASPQSITAKEEDAIRANEGLRAVEVKQQTDDLGITPGQTRVRLLFNNTKEARKTGGSFRKKGMAPVWTSESYMVLSRNGVNSWVVDVPPGEVTIWPSYTLRVVGTAEKQSEAKNKKSPNRVDLVVESQKRAFAREISEEEQEANMLPEGAKRRTRAKVNYNETAMADKTREKKVVPVDSEEKEPTRATAPAKKTKTKEAKTKEAKTKKAVEPLRRSTRERKQVERFGFP